MSTSRARPPLPKGRFTSLLVALLATLLAAPFLPHEFIGVSRYSLFFTLIAGAGIYAVKEQQRVPTLALLLAGPALTLEWTHYLVASIPLVVLSHALAAAFLGYVSFAVLLAVLSQERVTGDTLLGGSCIYLLLGMLWTILFAALEGVVPGSFQADGSPLQAQGTAMTPFRYPELIYLSFVTISTLGFGDVVPKSAPARALVSGEAIVGHLYLAIFIARLVGLHLVHSRLERD